MLQLSMPTVPSISPIRAKKRETRLALRVLGEIAVHKDPPGIAEAEDHDHQALSLAEELVLRPLMAQCHLG